VLLEAIQWVQDSALATWIRESSWALFALLILHTLTMGFLIGTGLAVDGRILGVAKRIPLPAMGRALPVMVWALGFAIVSGVLLLIGYPAKALTNPLFYAKLSILTVALLITRGFARRVFDPGLVEPPSWAKGAAALSILLWLAGLTAGKFLEYTHKMLLVY
jgi:hypothetical protein